MSKFQAKLLPELPPDPVPTEAEIFEIMARDTRTYFREDAARDMARLQWSIDLKKVNPDAFLVPFATCVPDYRKYLRRLAWRKIRTQVLDRAGNLCECCGGLAEECHHRDYRPRVLRGQDLLPLVAICAHCHQYVHVDPGTEKQRDSYNEQEAALAQIYGRGCRIV